MHLKLYTALTFAILAVLAAACSPVGNGRTSEKAPDAPIAPSVLPTVAEGVADPTYRRKGWTVPMPPDAKRAGNRKQKMTGDDGKQYDVTFTSFSFRSGYDFDREFADNPPRLDPLTGFIKWKLSQLTEVGLDKKVFMYRIAAYPADGSASKNGPPAFSIMFNFADKDGDGIFESSPKGNLTIPYWAIGK